jgi:hypothetical protein
MLRKDIDDPIEEISKTEIEEERRIMDLNDTDDPRTT